MITTSKLLNFSLPQNNHNEKLFKKQKFTTHLISPLNKYNNELLSNISALKKKFPYVQIDEIKSLLQELENDINMVSSILQEEYKNKEKNFMQEQNRNENQSLNQQRKEKNQYIKIDDIELLKKSLAKLFKKLKAQQIQKQLLSKKVSILIKQNQNLKLINHQLFQQQMKKSNQIKSFDIY